MSDSCLVCDRIVMIQNRQNPYFVAELETGYVVLGDHQFFRGYTLFLCKEHKYELHELDADFRTKFLVEMAEVAGAVYRAFQPKKLNYELLGNSDPHLHWHLFPRHANDPEPVSPVWKIDLALRRAESTKPSSDELTLLKEQLLQEIRNPPSYRDVNKKSA